MSTKTTLIICAVIIFIFGALYVFSRGNSSGGVSTVKDTQVNENDWTRGAQNPKVTLLEYSDFQCPACGAYEPVVLKIQKEFKDTLSFSYRHFPLSQIHQNALIASKASEAAGMQKKFWEMHDMLFENQSEWSTSGNAKDIFIGYAKKIGLDVIKFSSDIDSKEIEAKIKKSYEDGSILGVNATPTFFINGKNIKSPTNYDDFKKMIDEAIAGNNKQQ